MAMASQPGPSSGIHQPLGGSRNEFGWYGFLDTEQLQIQLVDQQQLLDEIQTQNDRTISILQSQLKEAKEQIKKEKSLSAQRLESRKHAEGILGEERELREQEWQEAQDKIKETEEKFKEADNKAKKAEEMMKKAQDQAQRFQNEISRQQNIISALKEDSDRFATERIRFKLFIENIARKSEIPVENGTELLVRPEALNELAEQVGQYLNGRQQNPRQAEMNAARAEEIRNLLSQACEVAGSIYDLNSSNDYPTPSTSSPSETILELTPTSPSTSVEVDRPDSPPIAVIMASRSLVEGAPSQVPGGSRRRVLPAPSSSASGPSAPPKRAARESTSAPVNGNLGSGSPSPASSTPIPGSAPPPPSPSVSIIQPVSNPTTPEQPSPSSSSSSAAVAGGGAAPFTPRQLVPGMGSQQQQTDHFDQTMQSLGLAIQLSFHQYRPKKNRLPDSAPPPLLRLMASAEEEHGPAERLDNRFWCKCGRPYLSTNALRRHIRAKRNEI